MCTVRTETDEVREVASGCGGGEGEGAASDADDSETTLKEQEQEALDDEYDDDDDDDHEPSAEEEQGPGVADDGRFESTCQTKAQLTIPPPPPSPADQFFVAYAIRDIPAGQELLWNYCAHDTDAGWLSCFGFVPVDAFSSQPEAPEPFQRLGEAGTGTSAPRAKTEVDEPAEHCGVGSDAALALYDRCLQQLSERDTLPIGMALMVRRLLTREKEAALQDGK
ncbi:hypothetical protein V8C86DRAFT_2736079 [Haematococcus lacustris]